MIELRWKKVPVSSFNHPHALPFYGDIRAVLQYREAVSERLVNTETLDSMRVSTFEGVDWQDVEISE